MNGMTPAMSPATPTSPGEFDAMPQYESPATQQPSENKSPSMTFRQQKLLGDMNGIARSVKEVVDDNTLMPQEKKNLITKSMVEYQRKRNELAGDLRDSRTLAAGVSPQRLALIKEVYALHDSLQRVARDQRLGTQERRMAIDFNANELRQKMEELHSAGDVPQGLVETMKDFPARIGSRLDELSGSLKLLPTFARQKLDEWTKPQDAGANPKAPDSPATDLRELSLF